MKRLTTAVVLLCMAGLTIAPGAGAASSPAVADCVSHGRLTRQYSVSQLHTALTELPADIQEYTNCYAVIQHALLGQVSNSGSAGDQSSQSSSSSFLPLPVIIVLVVLGLGAAGFGVLALRRR
jgi:hypothetical protein